jgi:predicted amidophosphoribosyltransferase
MIKKMLASIRDFYIGLRTPPDKPLCKNCIKAGKKLDPHCKECKKAWHEHIQSFITPPPH